MRTQVAKWGNSLAVRLPRRIVEEAGISEGASVEIDVTPEGEVRMVAARPRYSLDELLAGITPDNLPDEVFDDRPRGAERI